MVGNNRRGYIGLHEVEKIMGLREVMIVFMVYALSLVMWNNSYLPQFILDDSNLILITFLLWNLGFVWIFRYASSHA